MTSQGMVLRRDVLVGGGQRRVELPPQARPVFEEGCALIFTRWTALQLGVQNEWGGSSSAQKANELLQDVIGWFYNTKGARWSHMHQTLRRRQPPVPRLLPAGAACRPLGCALLNPPPPAVNMQTTRCSICRSCWMRRCSWTLASKQRTTARTRCAWHAVSHCLPPGVRVGTCWVLHPTSSRAALLLLTLQLACYLPPCCPPHLMHPPLWNRPHTQVARMLVNMHNQVAAGDFSYVEQMRAAAAQAQAAAAAQASQRVANGVPEADDDSSSDEDEEGSEGDDMDAEVGALASSPGWRRVCARVGLSGCAGLGDCAGVAGGAVSAAPCALL